MKPLQQTTSRLITVFLCGDVMTGRGIDQILPHPSDPAIYEPSMKSAKGHVEPCTGKLVSLRMMPMRIKHFRENRASREDAEWLRDTLSREGKRFGTCVELEKDNTLILRWGE
jgi:poly-gamma-glutamate capsule biosynthesis protein CapA/YwtB (metallophosphatase superfamily)